MKRVMVVLAVAGALLFIPAFAAVAHPLGNFTVNLYSGLRVQPGRVLVHYVVDMAEIPAFQERARIDRDGNGLLDTGERQAYAGRTCARLAQGVAIRVDGRTDAARVSGTTLTFPPGAAGLATMRLECRLVSDLPKDRVAHDLQYRDGNFAGRIGWHEITAVGDRSTILSSVVPNASISAELTRYPQDLLRSPLDDRSATIRFRQGGAVAPQEGNATGTLLPRGVDGVTRAFTSFLARRTLTVPLGLLALVIAVGLGAVHALAPGHGKTVMAAYVVGQQGSLRQAAMIGMTVTATHTAGVLVLGVLLSVSQSVASERLYPFLGLASGAMLCLVGGGLLRRAFRSRRATGPADHAHPHDRPVAPISMRAVAGMGVAGGLVPSPSALVVLLGAIALGRAWFGVVLVVAYGLGMAATLSGAGLLLSKARAVFEARSERSRRRSWVGRTARILPVVTSMVIVAVGLSLAARGLSQI